MDQYLKQKTADSEIIEGSFRDPSGFVFRAGGFLYRQVNQCYRSDYDLLHSSGLYDELTTTGLLVRHVEEPLSISPQPDPYKILKPELIPFISYPYEWSFSQLQQAALLTLKITEHAFNRGMVLKDASAFNVQFIGSQPIFIDTLSFERYSEGSPWIAYRQFCQFFLAPLTLMARCDIRLRQLLMAFPNGVPLDLASALLPWTSWLNPSLAIHLHLHARSQSRYAGSVVAGKKRARSVSRNGFLGILDSLRSAITGLCWRSDSTEWGDYYQNTNYSSDSMSEKKRIVTDFVGQVKPTLTWDLGGNDGTFSRIAAASGSYTVCADVDPSAVEKNFLLGRKTEDRTVLPLIIDLTNPSPSLGWAHGERNSLVERGPADLVLALALVHHLAISNNVPLKRVAQFFASCGGALIVEFIPKADSQLQKLLASREDIFPDYSQLGFESAFSEYFEMVERVSVSNSERTLYLMRAKVTAGLFGARTSRSA